MTIRKGIWAALTVIASLVLLHSCEEKEPDEAVSVSVKTVEADYRASNQYVSVSANCDWTLSIEFDGDLEWASLSETSGSGDKRDIVLDWDQNPYTSPRSLVITVKGSRTSAVCQFQQKAAPDSPAGQATTLKSDPVPVWLELPATDNPDLFYINHFQEYKGQTIRHHSLYLDPRERVSLWIAYPLVPWNFNGAASRSDEWGLDPKVPRRDQAVIFSAFHRGELNSYVRGHQLPSYERTYSHEANVKTFYGTNMTPQLWDFNGGVWVDMEQHVRDWSKQFDTLYVVTGCTIDGCLDHAYDNDGKAVAVPTGYYKALLGYKKSKSVGITSKTGGYTGIGYYLEHFKDYPSNYNLNNDRMTIDELEKITGVDFFVNLASQVGKDKAEMVESTLDPWWK